MPRAEERGPDARERLFHMQQPEHAVVGAEDGLLADDGRRATVSIVRGVERPIPRAAVEVVCRASSIRIGDDRRQRTRGPRPGARRRSTPPVFCKWINTDSVSVCEPWKNASTDWWHPFEATNAASSLFETHASGRHARCSARARTMRAVAGVGPRAL